MKYGFKIRLLLVLLICAGKITNGQDTVNSAKRTKQSLIKTSGSVGLGYDYGVLPFMQNFSGPSGYFKVDGNFNLQFKSLPFNSVFFYTNLKNVNGLNNYFRVSFDLQTYKSNLQQRRDKIKETYIKKLPALNEKYQLLQQKITYLNHVDANLEHYYALPDSGSISLPDSVLVPDINVTLPEVDSTSYTEGFQNFKDSIYLKKNQLLSESLELKNQINEYKNCIEGLGKPFGQTVYDTLVPLNKAETFFSHVQKLDIGMCYPSYSTFLVNNIPIKGINFEYGNKNRFFAFTAGSTINNLLFTNNIIQNNLQNTQNLFNFFDFNNPVTGRKIVSAKTGWGTKTGDHFFVGALYGTGMQSYYYDSTLMNSTGQNQREHNVVFELDGKIKPKDWLELDLVYGKSSVKPLADETDTLNTSLSQLFSPFRSNAFLGKANIKLEKIKSTFTISARWVDPFFRSFGVGFMRSDNLRYEIRTNHQISKKWKAGLFYRKDENNLLNLYSYQTVLHSGGANIRFKLNKNFTFSGLFNPVFQYSTDASTENSFTNQNYIAGLSVIHSYNKKKFSLLTNLTGNYYQLYNGQFNSEYLNLAISNTITCKQFSSTLSASYFDMKGMDSLSGNTVLLYNDLSWRMKKISLGGGLKLSLNNSFGEQFGYHAKVEAKIHKNVSLEIRGEKLVLGDFYNSIALDLYRSYPYIWSGKIIINW